MHFYGEGIIIFIPVSLLRCFVILGKGYSSKNWGGWGRGSFFVNALSE